MFYADTRRFIEEDKATQKEPALSS